MGKKRILYVCQEIKPYLVESDMASLCRALSQGMQERGNEIRTFMPRYGCINEYRNQLHEVIRLSGMNLIIDDNDHQLIIKVASIPSARVQIYFIDNDDCFARKAALTDADGKPFDDNDERAIFFARGVLETVKKLRWTPDIIHCQGWMSALVPLYIKTAYKEEPSFCDSKVVYALHNDELKQNLGSNFGNCIAYKDVDSSVLKDFSADFTFEELNKLAVKYADGLIMAGNQANPNVADYARSLQIPILEYPGENYADAYADFYDKVWSEGKNG